MQNTLEGANQIKEQALKEKQIATDELSATKMELSKVSMQDLIQLYTQRLFPRGITKAC